MRSFLTCLFCLLLITSSRAQTSFTDSLTDYIKTGLADWNLPGLAVVIVKDGQIVLEKGYGIRDIETRAPVDENTLFMIASNTKLFTATSLCQLEYDGKLSIDDKITKYFPDFALYEPSTTSSVSIRDMLSHRIGTKTFQGDFTFYNGNLSRREIMQKMRLLKPVAGYRQSYGYCNSCFLTAGMVIPEVSGKSWEQYVQDSILTPLQMNNTYTTSTGIGERKNVSRPYTTSFTGIIQRVPYDEWDNLGPAAAIVSSVADLSHWLLFQLDSGRYNGTCIMSFQVLQKTRDINSIVSSRKSATVPTHIVGYGLGLLNADYNGRQIFWHTGGAGGMVSNVCFVPEEKLGIAILTNNDNQHFFETLRYQILDRYLGVPYVNRSMQNLATFNRGEEKTLVEINSWKTRIKGVRPPAPIISYAGHYTNPLYGSMDITAKNQKLILHFNGHNHLSATAEYMDNGEWLLQYDNVEYGIFSMKFISDEHATLSVSIKENDFVEYDPYLFTRKND